MPVATSDIDIRLSVTTGAGDSTAQGNPNASLGEFMSTTNMGTALHDLFDLVSGAEDVASDVEYRCIFVHNDHATDSAFNVFVWNSADVGGGAAIALAADSAGVVAGNSASAQAIEINDEGDSGNELSGLTFAAHTSLATAISVGTLTAGQAIGIWVRRSAANNGPVNNDGFTLSVTFDTAA